MKHERARQERRKKKRRRQKRREREQRRPEDQDGFQMLLSPEGVTPDPERLAALHGTRMSDSLVELMQPYIPWPPAPDEIDELEDWLSLGAEVWNIVEEAQSAAACSEALTALAAELEGDDALEVVHAIARRKVGMFLRDRRRIAGVRVVRQDGRATVEAVSFGYVPGARR